MVEKLLSTEDYEKILKNRYGNSGIEYINSEFKPLSKNVEGLLGEHYKLEIIYSLNENILIGNFFVKTIPTKTQIQVDMCNTFNCYAKETFVYEFLFKEFERRNYNLCFAPKNYFCKNGNTYFMEDLNERGYILPERGATYDLSKCECLLKCLAQFHAGGFMLEEDKSKELGRKYKLDEDYNPIFNEVVYSGNEFMTTFYDTVRKVSKWIIDRLPESQEFKEDFKNQLEIIRPEDIFHKETKCRKILGHGDLWSNNMMFFFTNGVASKCCLLDYQFLRYYHPGYDVNLAILENTNSSFREKYFSYLIHFYYGYLTGVLKSHGHNVNNVMPFKDFNEGLQQVEYACRYQALAIHIFLNLPSSQLTDAVNKGNEELSEVLMNDDIEKYIVAYQNIQEYRDIIIEDLYDLHKCLMRQ